MPSPWRNAQYRSPGASFASPDLYNKDLISSNLGEPLEKSGNRYER